MFPRLPPTLGNSLSPGVQQSDNSAARGRWSRSPSSFPVTAWDMVNTPAASSEDTNNLRFMEHLPLGSGPERDPNVLPKLEHHFKGGGLPCQCHACLPKQTMALTLGSVVQLMYGQPKNAGGSGNRTPN